METFEPRKESASWKGCVVRQVSSCKFASIDSRGRDDESVTILCPAIAVLESVLGLYRRLVSHSIITLFFIFFGRCGLCGLPPSFLDYALSEFETALVSEPRIPLAMGAAQQ